MEKDILSDIIKKPEKLASAVYLITGFFNDLEPLKWKLRDISSELVSIGLVLRDNYRGTRNETLIGLRSIILEIRTHLGVARNAGLISEANHNLLDSEFSKYLELIGFPEGLKEDAGRAVLSMDFFKSERLEARGEQRPALPEAEISIKDRNLDAIKHEYLPPVNQRKFSDEDKGQKKSLKEFGAVSVKKNSRQSVIIGLLKRKKEIMIKDVSPLISGCSEKTIQRELLAMVKQGILEKHGEKRWSRYTLSKAHES